MTLLRKQGIHHDGGRLGMSLVELLAVMAIISLLIGLLLPAVQSARESARRTQCKNHLHQLGLAVHMFESKLGVLPAAAYGTPYNTAGPRGSIFTKLLPYLEQDSVDTVYDWKEDWFAPANQAATNQPVATFRCPSSVGRDVQKGLGSSPSVSDAPHLTAAVTDYTAVYSWGAPFAVPANPLTHDPWGVSALSPVHETSTGFFTGKARFQPPKLANTTDGSTYTLTFVERAASTERWIKGTLRDNAPVTAKSWAPWAGQGCVWILSYVASGETWAPSGLGPCNVNCNNHQGIYAFHPGGAHAAFLDGAVHFLHEGIEPEVLYAMVTRSRGDHVKFTD